MELVYLWVEDYKNIHRQGFNFSPRFHCEFKAVYKKDENGNEVLDEEESELTICDKKEKECKDNNYIENFFGENINVTAIVGKNGSGKSSVSESLQATNIIDPIFGETDFASRYIIVSNIDIDNFKGDKFISINKNLQIKTNIENLNYTTGEQFDENIFFLYESLFFDSELPYNKFNEYEIASNNFAVIPEFDNIKEYVYVDLEYNSICKKLLLIDDYFFLNIFEFIPKKLIIRPSGSNLEKSKNYIVYDYHKRPRFSDKIIEKVDDIIEMIYEAKDFFVFSLFLQNIDNFKEEEIEEALNKISNGENLIDVLQDYLDKTDTELTINEYESLLTEGIEIGDANLSLIVKYIKYIDIEIIDNKNRSFNNLSHGEKIFFGVVVNIIYFFQNSRNNNFLLFFDEPDLSLHPNWQKKYLDYLIKFLRNNYTDKKIHLIVTTHSPFLLSDIPKQNIIFLDTDENGNCKVVDGLKEKKETFGANIHTLLSDSFFMEDGLMGEFAKSRINEIIDFHKQVEDENKRENSNLDSLKTEYGDKKKRFWDVQSIIGEEYLKQVIKNHLVEIEKILLGKDKAKEEEIKRVEKYLESLKND